MASIIPYINFNGHAREAMQFYQQCLGGALQLQKLAESPMAVMMPSEMTERILRGALIKGDLMILASDIMGEKVICGNNIQLCISCSNREEMQLFFSNLSAGGKIAEPLQQTLTGATSGRITDKFGINWIFTYIKKE